MFTFLLHLGQALFVGFLLGYFTSSYLYDYINKLFVKSKMTPKERKIANFNEKVKKEFGHEYDYESVKGFLATAEKKGDLDAIAKCNKLLKLYPAD